MKEPTRKTAVAMQNKLLPGVSEIKGGYRFARVLNANGEEAKQKWLCEHIGNGVVGRSPGSLVEAFFKCREKVRRLHGINQNHWSA